MRFGNVLGTRGSVIPLFVKQIKEGGPITVTDPDMTRFFMTIPDAVKLIFKATQLMQGGEVFILKMPIIRLGDLVEALLEYFAPKFGYKPEQIKIRYLKSRPGEKHFEVLVTDSESRFALEKKDMFIILPHPEFKTTINLKKSKYGKFKEVKFKQYSSNRPTLKKDQIIKLIKKMGTRNLKL